MRGTATEAATSAGPPPPGMAIDHPPAQQALARQGRRPLGFLGMAAAGAVFAVVVGLAGADIWPFGISLAVAGVVLAIWQGLRWRWMRQVLRSSPWVLRRGHFHVAGSGKYAHAMLLLEADEHGPEVLCSVPELRWRVHALSEHEGLIDLWVAGDPKRRAVATADRSDVVPIAEPRWGLWRRLMRWRLERRGVPAAATRRS